MAKRNKSSKSDSHNLTSRTKKVKRDIRDEFLEISTRLSRSLDGLPFLKSLCVYDPTQYARSTYEEYVRRYCADCKRIMFLGMNPGPWGMSQTGVPFGEVDAVRNWLNIEGPVDKPAKEVSSRPVEGFSCKKSEVSGKRFWGLMKELCVKPENFFQHCFVYNYLPLQFISPNGKNVPPTLLKKPDQESLYKICDEALEDVVRLYSVDMVVGVGKFAETRARVALDGVDVGKHVKVMSILHPSPRSKAANNWRPDVLKQLRDLDLLQYLSQADYNISVHTE